MENKLVQLIRERGYVSFVEVRTLFPEETGDVSIAMPGYENIIYWWVCRNASRGRLLGC